jgi:hypothetical protein
MIGVTLVGEFGALVYLPFDGDFTMHREAGFSPAMLNVLRLAMSQGFTHVRFDADADQLVGLDQFD